MSKLPIWCCPRCGSEDTERQSFELSNYAENVGYDNVMCPTCSCEFRNVFKYVKTHVTADVPLDICWSTIVEEALVLFCRKRVRGFKEGLVQSMVKGVPLLAGDLKAHPERLLDTLSEIVRLEPGFRWVNLDPSWDNLETILRKPVPDTVRTEFARFIN